MKQSLAGSIFLGVVTLTAMIAPQQTQAFVAASNVKELKVNKPVHVIVAGRGDELGMLFQAAGVTKAEHILKLNAKAQILFLSAEEVSAREELTFFQSTSLREVQIVPGSLSSEYIFSGLKKLTNIQSIDFYTHATVKFGLRLDSYEQRLESIDDWSSLKGSLAKQSYIFFHGCNSGFELAPKVAQQLHVATMGSLTSTNFQKLTLSRSFIDADHAPIGTLWSNPEVYRMFADNSPYLGYWGNFSAGGLGFYKTFCPANEVKNCQLAMAKMIQDWVSEQPGLVFTSKKSENFSINKITLAKKIYENKVFDFLCPAKGLSTNGQQSRQRCEQALRNKDSNYNPFQGSALSCDFIGCNHEIHCPEFDDKCTLKTDVTKAGSQPPSIASTLVSEYQYLMKGFDLIAEQH